MNPKYILTIAVTLMVGVILTTGVLTPVIADTSSTTVSIDNEGAQWVRMAYVSDDTDYSVSVDVDGDVTITNGGNVQTGSVTDMIVYADSLCSVFISDGDIILVGSNGNGTQMIRLGDSFTIERASGVLTIGDGTSVYQPSGSVEWAYVPIGTGTYGSFGAGGLQRDQTPLVAVGSFAGIGCYNNLITPDYGLVMDADVTEEYITSVKWALGLGGQDDDDNAEQTEQTGPSPSPSLTVLGSPEPDTNGGEDSAPMDVSPETDAGDGDGDAEPTRGETEGSGGLRAAPSYTYTDGDWGYNLISMNPYLAQVVYYLGAGGDVSIPTSLGGYTVAQIGLGGQGNAVFDTSLAIGNLTITNGWTNAVQVNTYAFYGCNITGTLQLIGKFTLKDYAFANTGVIWADPVIENETQWGKNIFENCTGMTGTLTVNASSYFGQYCFKGTGISKIIVDKYVNSSTSTSNNFRGMSNLTEIEWNCGNSISSDTFGNGSGYPSLERIILTDGRVGERVFTNLSALTYVSFTNNASIYRGECFNDCPLLTTVVLPSSMTTLGVGSTTGCFNNCPLLSNIDLSHLTGINASFNKCPSLTSFDISSVSNMYGSFSESPIQTLNLSINSMSNCFGHCANLESITLNNTTSISGSFGSCTALRDVILPNTLTSIGPSFQYCGDAMRSLTIPISVPIPLYGSSSGSAFLNSASKLEHVTLLAGTGKGADYTASSPTRYQDLPWIKSKATLQDITLASGITKIGSSTFRDMTFPIPLPDTLVTIGDNAFYNCTGLTGTLSLPDSVASIGNYAFYQCTGLTGTLVISPSVSSVGAGAFSRCTGLTSLSWPISLSSAGCFTNVSNLTSITLTGTGDSADYTVSDYQTTPQYISRANLTAVTISEGVTSAGDYLLAECSNVMSLSIPSTLTEIGDHAFYQCTGLAGAFTLPQGVTSVGDYAFDGCGYSGELDIGNMRAIGDHAFSGCTFTGTLVLPAGLTDIGDNAFSDSSFDNMIVMSDATPSSDAFSGMAVRQVLNLSDAEYTKTSYGLDANEVRDEIDADSYICVVSYEETVYKEGAIYSLLPVIPLVAVAGLVIGVGVSIMRRGGE